MANQMSLSKAQVEALSKWFDLTVPESLDELVQQMGDLESASRIALLKERVEKSLKK